MVFKRNESRKKHSRFKAKPGIEDLEGRRLLAVQIVGNSHVFDNAGKITLKLERSPASGGLKKTEQVMVDTGGGTAVAGMDYVPIHQVITFKPGNQTKAVTIPIFPNSANTDTKTFALTLDHAPFPTNGSNPQAALVSIVHRVPSKNKSQSPPRIKKTLLLTSGDQVTAFVITFDKPMARGPVEDISNYAIHGLPGGSSVPLLWAVYNAHRHEVTLVPSHSVPVASYAVENPGPSPHSNLTDEAGNALDGVGDRRPNGILYATFAEKGPTVSPVIRAQITADMRIHSIKKARRNQQLGGSLGGLGGAVSFNSLVDRRGFGYVYMTLSVLV